MFKFTLEGTENLERRLEKLQKDIEENAGLEEISFNELFNPEFMQKHSRFASAEALREASPFKIESEESFNDERWDAFIRSVTSFESWQDMLKQAGIEYLQRKVSHIIDKS